MKGTIKLKKRGNKNLRIAMIGHKVVPSRRGGIERVLTIMCPLMIKKGHQVTCFEEIYSNAYVYVLPSKLEGMPLSLLEAMSYGNCVIGSDIAEIADVVEDKAILFKKANVEDLKEKLQMVCDDVELVEKYKREASGYICGKYNWEDVVSRTLRVYQKGKKINENLNDKQVSIS